MATANPFSGYGAFGGTFTAAPAVSTGQPAYRPGPAFTTYFFNQNPQAAGQEYLRGRNTNPFSGYGAFLGQAIPTLYSGYEAASIHDPTLDFLPWLGGQQGMLQNQFVTQLHRYQQGISPRRFIGGPGY